MVRFKLRLDIAVKDRLAEAAAAYSLDCALGKMHARKNYESRIINTINEFSRLFPRNEVIQIARQYCPRSSYSAVEEAVEMR